jgi:hypothetical protein
MAREYFFANKSPRAGSQGSGACDEIEMISAKTRSGAADWKTSGPALPGENPKRRKSSYHFR